MSWEQLANILDENRDYAQTDAEERDMPTICPIDGEVLIERNGVRNCPMGNFRWPN